MRAVQPVAHEFFSGDALALGDLRFVVWENVIDAAAVDIDLITEERRRHCAAFYMPSGTAGAPWTFPRHIAVFFVPRFPKRKIPDVFFVVFIVLHSPGRLQLREIEMRELPVIRKFVDAKIN